MGVYLMFNGWVSNVHKLLVQILVSFRRVQLVPFCCLTNLSLAWWWLIKIKKYLLLPLKYIWNKWMRLKWGAKLTNLSEIFGRGWKIWIDSYQWALTYSACFTATKSYPIGHAIRNYNMIYCTTLHTFLVQWDWNKSAIFACCIVKRWWNYLEHSWLHWPVVYHCHAAVSLPCITADHCSVSLPLYHCHAAVSRPCITADRPIHQMYGFSLNAHTKQGESVPVIFLQTFLLTLPMIFTWTQVLLYCNPPIPN